MAVCWLSARTCRGRASARLFVLATRLPRASRGHSFTLLALSPEGSEVEGPLATVFVLCCVHGEHTQRHSQHTTQVRNQAPPRQAGGSLGAQLEFPDFRCRRILRRRPGTYAGGNAPGRRPG